MRTPGTGLAVATIALLLMVSCAHAPPKKATGLKAADFWADQTVRQRRLAALSAKLYLRYTGRAESVAGRGRFIGQPPGRARLELRDPLGRTQFLVALDGEEFVAYYPTQKRAYVDKQAGTAYMKRFLGFTSSFRDVDLLLLGILPPAAKLERFDDWQWVEGAGVYRGRGSRGELKLTIDVDPDTAAIQEILWDSGREKARIVYGDFGKFGDEKEGKRTSFAHSASIRLDQFSSRLDAEWDDVTRLDELKARDVFQIALPEGVQKIPLP